MPHDIYSIDEAARIVGVRPATIRYWLRTFPALFPALATKKDRPTLTPEDIEQLQRIRELALEALLPARRVVEALSRRPPAQEPAHSDLPTRSQLEELIETVKLLRAEVLFLTEESKEMHRLLTLLTERRISYQWTVEKE